MNPTALHIFSKSTLAAIALARTDKESDYAAYANARALWRAAMWYANGYQRALGYAPMFPEVTR